MELMEIEVVNKSPRIARTAVALGIIASAGWLLRDRLLSPPSDADGVSGGTPDSFPAPPRSMIDSILAS